MRQIDIQLQELRQKLVLMGRLAESMIALALRGLTEAFSDSHVDEITSKEYEVDQLQLDIDAFAVKITALHQPVGADIRFLFMAPRIAEDLERIADHAVDIDRCIRYESLEKEACVVDVRIMGEKTQKMLAEVVHALIERDGNILERIERSEEEVDAFRDRILAELTHNMLAGAIPVPAALALLSISRSLERIGDHAMSIGMEMAYVASGKDVRHTAAPA